MHLVTFILSIHQAHFENSNPRPLYGCATQAIVLLGNHKCSGKVLCGPTLIAGRGKQATQGVYRGFQITPQQHFSMKGL